MNPIPEIARQLGERMRDDENIQDLAVALLRVIDRKTLLYDLPYIPTKDLVDLGKSINRAAHEDPQKDGKVGRIAVEEITRILGKMKEASENS